MALYKMFGFIRITFFTAMTFFICHVLNVNPLKYISMNNHDSTIRTKTIDINNNEPSCCCYSIEVSKCSSSCNNINDPYAKISLDLYVLFYLR